MRVLLVTIIIILLDQATKLAVKARFELDESITILGNFLHFTYIENPGMAFGIRFAGPWFFTAFSIVASTVLLIYLYTLRREKLLARLPLAVILGGAVGNLIDRIRYEKVVDFIHFSYKSFNFPVFNIADCAVTAGMILLIAVVIFEREEEQKDKSTLRIADPNPADSEERDIWHS